MKKIKCVNPKNYNLTLNEDYELVNESADFVTIRNNNNKVLRYSKDLFEISTVIAEPVTAPLPPPPPPRTEQDCINSIVIEGNQLRYHNMNNELITFGNISLGRLINNDFSCGVARYHDLNYMMSRIDHSVDTSDDDMINLRIAIFKAILTYNFNRSQIRFHMFSTNFDINFEDYFDVLDEMAGVSKTEWASNPNSGNDIKVWVITQQ